MAKIVYGIWDGKKIDNRKKRLFEIPEEKFFSDFDEFNPGNPIKAFLGDKGFFVFDKEFNLLEALKDYIERASMESCGKCTPCRVGTRILKARLEELMRGEAEKDVLDEILSISEHIKETSLCGLGQTATVVLSEAIIHFRDEIEKWIGKTDTSVPQHSTTYVTAPCIEACPAKVEVPKYIDYIKNGKFTHSIGVILQKYPMAATCGRVCVRFCEAACRRTMVDEPVGIKLLKRFVADRERYVTDHWFTPDLIPEKKDPELKVAIVGAGPAGISAAYHLLLRGYPVDIFEAMTEAGGMAAVGIPNYRLPKDEILRKEISIIETLGGKIHYNQRMGVDFTLEDLFKRGYKAVFLGVGLQKGKLLNIPGEDRSVSGYITGVRFLLFINHYYINMGLQMDIGKRVVVVGGGNVAMDCARSALRLGVEEVHLVYRRSKAEMPADPEEVEAAEKEGVKFNFLSQPVRILTEDGKVKGIELIRMKLGEPDESGRRKAIPIEGSEYVIEADFIIVAIGQTVDTSFLSENDGITLNKWGNIEVDKNLMTKRKGVFAGGDCVTGPATLIEAMAQGEKAAKSIDDYLQYGRVKFKPDDRMSELLSHIRKITKDDIKFPLKNQYRVKVKELDPEVRKKLFEEVEKPISVEEAYKEAERCMRCYRIYSVVTENEVRR